MPASVASLIAALIPSEFAGFTTMALTPAWIRVRAQLEQGWCVTKTKQSLVEMPSRAAKARSPLVAGSMAGLPVVPVSSLQTLAQAAYRQYGARAVLAAFDARMQEIYAGAYALDADGLMQAITPEVAGAPATLPAALVTAWAACLSGYVADSAAGAVAAGSGWATYGDSLAQTFAVQQVYADLAPDAEDVATLAFAAVQAGRAVAPELALPVYLRDDVWKKLPGR